MTASPLDQTRALLSEAADMVTDARRQVAEGHVISLAPLEDRVQAACTAVRGLAGEAGGSDMQAARSDLESLLYDLDALATEMTSRFGEQAHRPADATAGRKARPTIGALMPGAGKPPPETSFET